MWKNEKFCLLVHKHLFVFKIKIIWGSPIEMMEVSGRDQGKSLLVDNNLLSIYFLGIIMNIKLKNIRMKSMISKKKKS